ncbi:aromatic ring-hydroxylating dioxygenase subunit alpha [Peptostreptococcus russellii]|uniref:aromatic ring-hydroxylating oxygenase subunit alpha n=1 Tax=Peptostreptococcus russellii TaxID=215200 RepID=UPI0016264B7B|nr:aromatic ring-hydroxylating dioxygenase subunit alpha [Peptostreptococcus russellii]MBC2578039.1 aromatic ring-hydroxylating dioxygenase subunit alpha [Peptostreptococcus russellii]
MIKNKWYAILSSSEIKNGQLLGVKRLGENYVLYRDKDGKISCFADKCAHRGAALSKGWKKENDCIVCPFHGIEYDKTGKCVHIPSEGKNSEKDFSKFNLKKYYAEEKNNIVYFWNGEGEPTEEIDYFEMDYENMVYSEICDHWKVHYSRVIENQLDVSHLPFVHYNTIGKGNKTLVNGPKVIWIDENTLQTSANNQVDEGQKPLKASESKIKSTNIQFKFPNTWLNTVNENLKIMAYFVPVDDDNTLLYIRFYNKITKSKGINKLIAWFGKFANKKIERQDKVVVETQTPNYTSFKMDEKLLQADRPIIEYRKHREFLKNNLEENEK